jgi:hypothetical protein
MSPVPHEEVFKEECRKYILAGQYSEQTIAERVIFYLSSMLRGENFPDKDVLGEVDLVAYGIPQLDVLKIKDHFGSVDQLYQKMMHDVIRSISYFLSLNALNVINYIAENRQLLSTHIEVEHQNELVTEVIKELALEIAWHVFEYISPLIEGKQQNSENAQWN